MSMKYMNVHEVRDTLVGLYMAKIQFGPAIIHKHFFKIFYFNNFNLAHKKLNIYTT